MMILALFFIILAFLVVALVVLSLEVVAPQAPLTIALRTWQTGLSALLGLVTV